MTKKSERSNIKLNSLEKDTTNNFYRIDKILNTSIIYPRIIGNNSKFKTFHEYIDYTINQLNSYEIFKSRIELDLTHFKSKIDKMIQSFEKKLECSINDSHQIVKNGVKENELIIKDYITGKIYDFQVKNAEFEQKINKNIEDMNAYITSYQEKIKLFDEKMEEKMNLSRFEEEKALIYQSIGKCKEDKEELVERINILEKYKESQEKNNFWNKLSERKIQRNYSGLSMFPGKHPDYDLMDLNEREKYVFSDNSINQDKNDINNQNSEGKNNINS